MHNKEIWFFLQSPGYVNEKRSTSFPPLPQIVKVMQKPNPLHFFIKTLHPLICMWSMKRCSRRTLNRPTSLLCVHANSTLVLRCNCLVRFIIQFPSIQFTLLQVLPKQCCHPLRVRDLFLFQYSSQDIHIQERNI